VTLRTRRFPVGAEILQSGLVHFRVWAPSRRSVRVIRADRPDIELELSRDADGYFAGGEPGFADVGSRYAFRLDGAERSLPDPASRFQPEGPHGPSEVVDPARYRWRDRDWRGPRLEGQVIYELHVGTFTREGTYAAARRELVRLVELGVTSLELLPVAEFPGAFGWGYDGVDLFAPYHLYGSPDELRELVDEAHAHGLGVLLDVVYNHLGPEGNYLREFSPDYFSDRYENEWGDPLNFDGGLPPVRDFFVQNARYWLEEFHLDGLRIDATQSMFDASEPHILSEIVTAARRAAGSRSILIVAENEPEDPRLVRSQEQGGYGLDAIWNEDFHHSAIVAGTGRTDGYYAQHAGSAQELLSAIKRGFLYQGQWYGWQKSPRGSPASDLAAPRFIHYLQNHDQIANTPFGRRLHHVTSPGRLRALTALLLLAPQTPHLFQGQEFGAASPFHYFADLEPALAGPVRRGRAEFLVQFPSLESLPPERRMPDPGAPDTFEQSKLDVAERSRSPHAEIERLHRDLLALRKRDPLFCRQDATRLDGAVLAPDALILRFFDAHGGDRLVLFNLGHDLVLDRPAEPLLAPPVSRCWHISWSSEDPAYGGSGPRPIPERATWTLQGEALCVLAAVPIPAK
jgi:maltooligosyltrehalose trehalohydrolase